VVASVGNSILPDFHYTEERVYWANKKAGVIYKAAMDGTQRQKLYLSEKGISGLVFDWVHNFVIWTSGEKGTIKRVDPNRINERTLLRHLSEPNSIAVAPNDRLNWTQNSLLSVRLTDSAPSLSEIFSTVVIISPATSDLWILGVIASDNQNINLRKGINKRVVASVGNSILPDFHYTEERVYWANKKAGVIYKAAMDGTQRQKLYLSEKGISGLVFDWVHNFVIWTSGEKGTIKRVDPNRINERTLLRHLSEPNSIAVAPND
ncbi:unnamed protein product, partial [Coregonus sp. 'balchen']